MSDLDKRLRDRLRADLDPDKVRDLLRDSADTLAAMRELRQQFPYKNPTYGPLVEWLQQIDAILDGSYG